MAASSHMPSPYTHLIAAHRVPFDSSSSQSSTDQAEAAAHRQYHLSPPRSCQHIITNSPAFIDMAPTRSSYNTASRQGQIAASAVPLPPATMHPSSRHHRRHRQPIACDPCRASKRKCSGSLPCDSCVRRGKNVVCRYDKQSELKMRERIEQRGRPKRKAATAARVVATKKTRRSSSATPEAMPTVVLRSARSSPRRERSAQAAPAFNRVTSSMGPSHGFSMLGAGSRDHEYSARGHSWRRQSTLLNDRGPYPQEEGNSTAPVQQRRSPRQLAQHRIQDKRNESDDDSSGSSEDSEPEDEGYMEVSGNTRGQASLQASISSPLFVLNPQTTPLPEDYHASILHRLSGGRISPRKDQQATDRVLTATKVLLPSIGSLCLPAIELTLPNSSTRSRISAHRNGITTSNSASPASLSHYSSLPGSSPSIGTFKQLSTGHLPHPLAFSDTDLRLKGLMRTGREGGVSGDDGRRRKHRDRRKRRGHTDDLMEKAEHLESPAYSTSPLLRAPTIPSQGHGQGEGLYNAVMPRSAPQPRPLPLPALVLRRETAPAFYPARGGSMASAATATTTTTTATTATQHAEILLSVGQRSIPSFINPWKSTSDGSTQTQPTEEDSQLPAWIKPLPYPRPPIALLSASRRQAAAVAAATRKSHGQIPTAVSDRASRPGHQQSYLYCNELPTRPIQREPMPQARTRSDGHEPLSSIASQGDNALGLVLGPRAPSRT